MKHYRIIYDDEPSIVSFFAPTQEHLEGYLRAFGIKFDRIECMTPKGEDEAYRFRTQPDFSDDRSISMTAPADVIKKVQPKPKIRTLRDKLADWLNRII